MGCNVKDLKIRLWRYWDVNLTPEVLGTHPGVTSMCLVLSVSSTESSTEWGDGSGLKVAHYRGENTDRWNE